MSSGLDNETALTLNFKNMHLAGNLASCAKVNTSKKSALLDPRMREYAPSAGFEERCNSDYTRRDAVSSPRRLKRLCKYNLTLFPRRLTIVRRRSRTHPIRQDGRPELRPGGCDEAWTCT